ncbi:MAG: STM4014 family protein [Chloroflexi bacterium]|nr:STM4014 family protein [Chloroflexota bacterium]MCI0647075.1 STM4014 family protein [Chloroflexota bacterium]
MAWLGLRAAEVIAYRDLLSGRVALPDAVRPGSVVRIDSPGQDFEVEQQLLALGAGAPDDEAYARLSGPAVAQLAFERGRLLYPRQWYLGFCRALELIEQQLAGCPSHRLMNQPAEIALMFDKRRCQAHLLAHGVPVPRTLGPVHSFDELVTRMQQANCYRVFVKLAHGSSASGVVAYQTNGRQHQATTTVEMVRQDGELRLYNSLRLHTYRRVVEIAELINALCRHCVHVEQWIPKAGLGGRRFDLRVLTIAGQVRHTVVRLSRGPMTNLHLANKRGPLAELLTRMAPAAWEDVRSTCEAAARCFPASLYAGLDVLVAPGYRRHAILEANAFGDLLLGVLCDGVDTYTAEIQAVLAAPNPVGRGTKRAL